MVQSLQVILVTRVDQKAMVQSRQVTQGIQLVQKAMMPTFQVVQDMLEVTHVIGAVLPSKIWNICNTLPL
jgi:hypothetical protein